MEFVKESCESFARLLASKSPVPGGGGAAAVVGALSAALCSMAGNFTLGKKKYADVEGDIKIILDKAELLRINLLALVDEDAQAFEPLSRAYSIAKDDPSRDEILESALLNACQAPLKIIEHCAGVVEILEETLAKGSRLLISDVGCGALLSRAAMESAALNIFVNTSLLKDKDKTGELENKTNKILNEYCPRASEITKEVQRILMLK